MRGIGNREEEENGGKMGNERRTGDRSEEEKSILGRGEDRSGEDRSEEEKSIV